MLKTGILNPAINELLSRIRHTNILVIADRGFPYWPMIETVDISLVDDVPTVLQVFAAVQPNFNIGQIYMAQEFLDHNIQTVKDRFQAAFGEITVIHERHDELRRRVPDAIGLIRTADTIPYANLILVSA